MSNKKQTKAAELVFDLTKIVLRSVYDKANIKYYILPCKDKYGQYPPCVKAVNSLGDMIMSDKERDEFAEGKRVFFPENRYFIVLSGKVYNLNNMYEAAEWECIKNCPLIAKSRDERDANGNLIIDGAKSTPEKPTRNGVAELYVYRPGLETQRKVTKKQLIHNACTYIYQDEKGLDGLLHAAKLLGRDMRNQATADIIDYLISVAEADPQKIINIYTGTDTSLRLLFIDAKEKNVIRTKNRLYIYGDNIALGATDDAVITWMKDPHNFKLLELIKKDTYPELYTNSND